MGLVEGFWSFVGKGVITKPFSFTILISFWLENQKRAREFSDQSILCKGLLGGENKRVLFFEKSYCGEEVISLKKRSDLANYLKSVLELDNF